MREILFRGKKKFNDEWVFGHYVVVDPVDRPEKYREPIHLIVPVESKFNSFDGYLYYRYPIIPETLGQFTGLLDKNGEKVFEGDILAYRLDDFEDETIDGVVKYGNMNCGCCYGVYGWYIENGDIRALDMEYGFDDDQRLYVIGNIHDNPELLNERNQ